MVGHPSKGGTMDLVDSNLHANFTEPADLVVEPDRRVAEPDWLDHVEARIASALGGKLPDVKNGEAEGFPITHRFTPGLYTREIFMPAHSVVVSKIHKTEHPYVVSQGNLWVMIEGVGWEHIVAPHTGITKPGTRRLLFMETDTVWTTFHVTQLTCWEEIEREIIEPHDNPLLEPFRVAQVEGGESV